MSTIMAKALHSTLHFPNSTTSFSSKPIHQKAAPNRVLCRMQTTRIHRLIEEEGVVLMPGCFDALSAAIVQKTGFSAGFISGYALSASLLGKPDFGLLTLAPCSLSLLNLFNFSVNSWLLLLNCLTGWFGLVLESVGYWNLHVAIKWLTVNGNDMILYFLFSFFLWYWMSWICDFRPPEMADRARSVCSAARWYPSSLMQVYFYHFVLFFKFVGRNFILMFMYSLCRDQNLGKTCTTSYQCLKNMLTVYQAYILFLLSAE